MKFVEYIELVERVGYRNYQKRLREGEKLSKIII